MIRNKFTGRCANSNCRCFVKAGEGYVTARRIFCADCASLHQGDDPLEREDHGDIDDSPIYGFGDV